MRLPGAGGLFARIHRQIADIRRPTRLTFAAGWEFDLASEGQLNASGLFPAANAPGTACFAVRIRLDDAENLRLPAGTQGAAAVYTGNVQIAGVIRMALMRVSSWTNYLFFTA